MRAIVTIPPNAAYMSRIAAHPLVEGVRLNTVMPVAGPLENTLGNIRSLIGEKELYVDLKGRQLRVTGSSYIPYHYIKLSHKIKIDTPFDIYIHDMEHVAKVTEIVDGNRLIVESAIPFPVGAGMSINIKEPSLEIEGYLTGKDEAYIEASKKAGNHNYLLSYVEKESDITDVLSRDPEASLILKIESQKGLDFIDTIYPKYKESITLMAAQGDLYYEVRRPHLILNAVEKIIKADPSAIAASRIFSSLARSSVPSCQDIESLGYLAKCGYKTVMFGDELGFSEDSVETALNLLNAISRDYINGGYAL